MRMTKGEYRSFSESRQPHSPVGKHAAAAFLVGGLICCLGQLLLELFGRAGLDKQGASTAAAIVLVLLGAALTGLGVYDDVAKFAGAGTLVPITGFANSIAAPALEFKTEGFITGTAAKMFVIAGPVLVYGIAASVVYGLLLVLFG